MAGNEVAGSPAACAGSGVAVAAQDVPVPLTRNPLVSAEYTPTATQLVRAGQATADSSAPGTVAPAGSGALIAFQLVPCSVTSMPCRLPRLSRYEPTAVQEAGAGQATETSSAAGRASASGGSGAARPDHAEPCPVTSSASSDGPAAYWPTATQAEFEVQATDMIRAPGFAAALPGSGAVVAVQVLPCPA